MITDKDANSYGRRCKYLRMKMQIVTDADAYGCGYGYVYGYIMLTPCPPCHRVASALAPCVSKHRFRLLASLSC